MKTVNATHLSSESLLRQQTALATTSPIGRLPRVVLDDRDPRTMRGAIQLARLLLNHPDNPAAISLALEIPEHSICEYIRTISACGLMRLIPSTTDNFGLAILKLHCHLHEAEFAEAGSLGELPESLQAEIKAQAQTHALAELMFQLCQFAKTLNLRPVLSLA